MGLEALDGTDGDGAHPVFERLFWEVGPPLAILTDNEPPFVAPCGLHGLTKLSVAPLRHQALASQVQGLPPSQKCLPHPSRPSFSAFR